MTQQPSYRKEDQAATHARLSADALASHANACAAADAFLVDGTTPGAANLPADIVLADTADGRLATIDAGTPDERQFTITAALRVYVRTCLVSGIATDGEVRKMRQRLVKRIVKAVGEDKEPQTVGAHAHDRCRQETPDSDEQTAGRRKERA